MTGPADATKGIVVIYDIFGYFDQTVQGADILATSHAEKYRVFIPDWFHGEPCPIEWYVFLVLVLVLVIAIAIAIVISVIVVVVVNT